MNFNIWEDYEYMDLPDVLSFIVDNRGKTVPVDENGNYILIATNCIRNENLYPTYDKIRKLNEDTYNNWFRAHPEPGDIIFVNKGTPGRVCMVPDPVDFCIAQDMMAFRVKPELLYNKYLFAVLRSNKIQNQISATTVGDVIPHFKKSHLHEIKIPIPPMDIQRIIGDYYFLFSEKIIVNEKINRNLLEQAQALFEKRFIDDFDCDTKIPLYDFADFINGTSFKKHEYSNTGVPIIKIAELKNGITESTKFFDGEKNEKFNVSNRDILFSWSGNPETSIDIFIWTKGQGILNQHTFNVKSYTEHNWFVFLMLKYFKPEFTRIASHKQTTGLGHITVKDLKRLEFAYDIDEIESFEEEISPFMTRIYNNMIQSNKLTKLRDTLLPKLMSGELSVSDLET